MFLKCCNWSSSFFVLLLCCFFYLIKKKIFVGYSSLFVFFTNEIRFLCLVSKHFWVTSQYYMSEKLLSNLQDSLVKGNFLTFCVHQIVWDFCSLQLFTVSYYGRLFMHFYIKGRLYKNKNKHHHVYVFQEISEQLGWNGTGHPDVWESGHHRECARKY